MIRTLAIALGIVTVMSVVFTVMTSMRGSPAMGQPVSAAPPPVVVPEPEAPETQRPTARDPIVTLPAESTVDQEVDTEAVVVVDPVIAAYTRVRTLIESAGREERTAQERIDDLELALEGLNALDEPASTSKPDDLAQTISQVERELERLRLQRDFFGEGG